MLSQLKIYLVMILGQGYFWLHLGNKNLTIFDLQTPITQTATLSTSDVTERFENS